MGIIMKKWKSILLFCFTFTLAFEMRIPMYARAEGISVDYHTEEEIRNFINGSGAKSDDVLTYNVNPVVEAPYASGSLSEETLKSSLAMLNQVRYIAGLSHNVTLDNERNREAQAAALVNYANKELSHKPNQPAGMAEELFKLGYKGASSSNIAYTSRKNTSLNYSILNLWMADDDKSNIAVMGHRRWLLNPALGKVGFGAVTGPSGTYSAVSIFDTSNTSAEVKGVVWPAQTMPTDYFAASYPWTVITGNAEDLSKIEVTLTRRGNHKSWHFSESSSEGEFYVSNTLSGQTGCIVFRPELTDFDGYTAGDVYDVKIIGAVCGTIEYTVSFFDLVPVEQILLSTETITLKENGSGQMLTASVLPGNASNCRLNWSSSDNEIVSITAYAKSVYLSPGKAGTAMITATYPDGAVKASCQVTVEHIHVPGPAPTCTNAQTCTKCYKEITPALGHEYKTTVVKAKPQQEGSIEEKCVRCGDCKSIVPIFAPANIIVQESFIYNGTKIEPEITVLDSKFQEIDHKYYTVAYENNIEPGNAKVVVELQGNYSGVMTAVFQIKTNSDNNKPSDSPSSQPTLMPSNPPSSQPTLMPSNSPSSQPTLTPSSQPTLTPSSSPSSQPTLMPSNPPTSQPVPTPNKPSQAPSGNTSTETAGGESTNIDNTTTASSKPEAEVKNGSIVTVGSFTYKITNESAGGEGTVALTKVWKAESKVKIASAIKMNGVSYKITAISNKAFRNNKKITSLDIGRNVITIGDEAFSGCTKLKKITIGEGVLKIGKKGFYNCKGAVEVTIKSTKLKKKNVGVKAFTNLGNSSKEVKIRVPKSKVEAYKKIFQSKS